LRRVQSSEPLNTKKPPASCFFGTRFVQNPFFLLSGALLFYEKIRQSVALFWFGLRDIRVSSNILLTIHNQKEEQLLTFPHFCRPVWQKRFGFLYTQLVCRIREGLEALKSFQIFKIKNLQRLMSFSKHISG
jgi:hypothetical protein